MPQLMHEQTSGRTFLGFSGDTSVEQARKVFRDRYGHDPDLVGTSLGNVLAGPVPNQEARR